MKQVLRAISELCKQHGWHYYFADEPQSNIEADYIKSPAVFVYALRFSDNIQRTNYFGDKNRVYTFRIDVLEQTKLDWLDEQRIDYFERCDTILSAIIHGLRHLKINDERVVKDFVAISGRYVKNRFDNNMDGLSAEISLTIDENISYICPNKVQD